MSYQYPDESFEDEYYPGSTRKIPKKLEPPKEVTIQQVWDSKPLVKMVRGRPTELFPIGSLASALNRKSVTIRKWEMDHLLPRASIVQKGNAVEGNRRLYTRAQIEGLVEIAREEHLLDDPMSRLNLIQSTRFKERALQLWKDTSL